MSVEYMDDTESIWLQKKLAIEGIKSGITTSLGVAIMGIGFALIMAKESMFGVIVIVLGEIIVIKYALDSKKRIWGLKFSNNQGVESTTINIQQEKISCKNQRPSFWLSKTHDGLYTF